MVMSETKFTPGPWAFDNYPTLPINRSNSLRIYATDPGPDNDFTIAYVRDVDDQIRLVHANLISSAPELYAALEWWINYKGDNCDAEFEPIAMAALRKARGK
jgi:hypothetical protein